MYQLAKSTGLMQSRISQIVKGKRSITADTAIRISIFFGNSPTFWLGLQNDFDIEQANNENVYELESLKIWKYNVPKHSLQLTLSGNIYTFNAEDFPKTFDH